MNSRKEELEKALMYYNIEILSAEGNFYQIARGYEIEVEQNGIFRLKDNGMVVAPFADPEELCRFVLL